MLLQQKWGCPIRVVDNTTCEYVPLFQLTHYSNSLSCLSAHSFSWWHELKNELHSFWVKVAMHTSIVATKQWAWCRRYPLPKSKLATPILLLEFVPVHMLTLLKVWYTCILLAAGPCFSVASDLHKGGFRMTQIRIWKDTLAEMRISNFGWREKKN